VLLIVIPCGMRLLVRVSRGACSASPVPELGAGLAPAFLEQASSAFLYTPFTVFLTLTYVCVPFVFVTSYTALERIPGSLIEASEDSGANGWQTFRNVIWPLSRQGAALGFSLAFLVAVGDYVTPSMVGGLDGTMLGMVIASQFGLAANWPLGAAMAITLMIVVVVVLVVVASLTRTRGILESADNGMTMDRPLARGSWASRARSYRRLGVVPRAVPGVVCAARRHRDFLLQRFDDSDAAARRVHDQVVCRLLGDKRLLPR
jgi:spermidine/putrescine transport system permease protein